MSRDEILHRIRENKPDLARFHVRGLALFGSVARDEAKVTSDVDVLVDFTRPVGLFTFLRLKEHLEQLLGLPVDLVTRDALKPQLRSAILREAVPA